MTYPWSALKGFFFKITYSPDIKRIHVYNFGCNMKCLWCYYRLKTPKAERRISVNKVKEVLKDLVEKGAVRVNFLGGEPTINPDLPNVVDFAEKIGLTIKLITNGSIMPPKGVHEANIGIKAVSDDLMNKYAGYYARPVLKNFKAMYNKGIKLDVSTIMIPGLTDDEIVKIAKFLGEIDMKIPLHIIGYVSVPGAPWRMPTAEEVRSIALKSSTYLNNVTWSRPDPHGIKYNSLRIL